MTAEFRSTQAKIKNQLKDMHSELSKMTRTQLKRKNQKQSSLPQSYKIWNTILCQKANSQAQF